MKMLLMCAIALFNAPVLWGADPATTVTTVDSVDIERYMGTWYEIAKYPQKFEKGLVGVTAEYALLPNGNVRVINSGYKNDFNGKRKIARGKAWIVDKTTNAKLKVMFFWPFAGNYWIVDLGKDYEYAIVGDPSRKYLWILYREPFMDEALYERLLQKIEALGFDPARLEKNPQKEFRLRV